MRAELDARPLITAGLVLGIGLGGRLAPLLGWRAVFRVSGAAGLLAIPLLFVMIAPTRSHEPMAADVDPRRRIVGDALRDVRLRSIWL